MVAEDEVTTTQEFDSAHLTTGTKTFGKNMDTFEGPSEKGGASTPNKVAKQCQLPATSVGRLATTKRSAERKEVSQTHQSHEDM